MMSFGEKLRQLRKDKRITQRELAKKIGVDFTYISKIETGALEPPSEKIIFKISKILNVDEYDMVVLAKKIPTEYKEVIIGNELADLFLRRVPTMSNEKKERIKKMIQEDD